MDTCAIDKTMILAVQHDACAHEAKVSAATVRSRFASQPWHKSANNPVHPLRVNKGPWHDLKLPTLSVLALMTFSCLSAVKQHIAYLLTYRIKK